MNPTHHEDHFVARRPEFMPIRITINSFLSRLVISAAIILFVLVLAGTTSAKSPATSESTQDDKQAVFASPEEALQSLTAAAKTKDRTALAGMFGGEYDQLLSGDAVQDNQELDAFAAALDRSAKLTKVSDVRYTMAIGEDNWHFPIPIVKESDHWRFDTAAGMEEILNRRIGHNELSAISVCRAYVLAQWEYFTEGDHDNDGVAEYAQHFISSAGNRDGLYWDTAENEKPSPLGALITEARAEGYSAGRNKSTRKIKNIAEMIPRQRSPYHGYYFRILKSQGPHAPGGKYNYVINGNMIAGYALIAYPDKLGSSGVMTFIVNQQGRVYEKNLGPNTVKLAGAITEYDPDASWKVVKE
jgi:hypothetical protein